MGTDSQSDGRIDLERARNIIAKIWFGGAGLCFALVMFQSITGRFEGVGQEIWAWFTPTVVPTLGLSLELLRAPHWKMTAAVR